MANIKQTIENIRSLYDLLVEKREDRYNKTYDMVDLNDKELTIPLNTQLKINVVCYKEEYRFQIIETKVQSSIVSGLFDKDSNLIGLFGSRAEGTKQVNLPLPLYRAQEIFDALNLNSLVIEVLKNNPSKEYSKNVESQGFDFEDVLERINAIKKAPAHKMK